MNKFILGFIFLIGIFFSPKLVTNCTITVSNSTDLVNSINLQPGAVLCLRAGTYSVTQLRLRNSGNTTNRLTLQAYPGEQVILQASVAGGMYVDGSYWTLDHIIVDNNHFSNPAISINSTADHFELLNSEVRNGQYNGIDVWGNYARIENDVLHNFWPSNQVVGNDAQCINIHQISNFGIIRNNTIFDCWGDGTQFFALLPVPIGSQLSTGWIIDNNKYYRGTLGYSENSIDVKDASQLQIINNDISGYDNTRYLGTCQPAIVLHGLAYYTTILTNTIHDNCKGIELSNGTWFSSTIQNNTITNIKQFGMEFAAARGLLFDHNTINITGEVFQVASSGWIGGSFDHNLIQNGVIPRLYSGASWSNVTLGPNAWINTQSGFMAGTGDITNTASGFGITTPIPTATKTSTVMPTSTPTSTFTPIPTNTPTPTPINYSGCFVQILSLLPFRMTVSC